MKSKRLLSAMTAAMVLSCTYLPTVNPAVYGTVYAESEDLIINVNKENNEFRGTTDDGFTYDVWVEKERDISGSATIRKDGTISMDWDTRKSTGDFIFEYGMKYDPGIKIPELNDISIDYEADYSAGENGNSQLGVHGWLGERTEFYIIDDWVNWKPSSLNCKTAVIDGGEYDIFMIYDSVGDLMPLPEYDRRRYYSVRKQPRSSGTISVTDHIKAWANLGWSMDSLLNVSFNVSGWESEGSAEIKKLNFNVSDPVNKAEKTYTVDTYDNHVKGIDENGYKYDVLLDRSYSQKSSENGSLTVRDDGTLSAEWDSSWTGSWFEADYGYEYPSGTKAMDLGKISVDYDAQHKADPASERGNSRIGVHGWFTNPLVEFYVIDNWINWCPSDDNAKTVVIDGAEYYLFKSVHSIESIDPAPHNVFSQYFSVRKEPRTSGTITLSDHFKAWEKLGWEIGDLYTVGFNISGWESVGSAEIQNFSFNAPKPDSTTTNDDDKNYVEVVNKNNFGKGELIPPYVYYSNTKTGHMYAAKDGCFKASSDAGDISSFSAGIEKSEELLHIIGNNPATVDYKFENNYEDYYQLAYKLSGKNYDKYTDIIIVENNSNYPIQYNLKDILSSRRVPIIFGEDPPVKTYTVNGHTYDLYRDECTISGMVSVTYETYIAVRKDQEEGINLEGSIDFNEHMKQIDENLADNMEVNSLFCVLDSDGAEGSIKALKNDITFETDDYPFYIMGDFNFDRVIDSLDIAKAKADLIKWSDDYTPSEYMDLNQDNKYDIADIVMLKSFVLGKIKSFDKAVDTK